MDEAAPATGPPASAAPLPGGTLVCAASDLTEDGRSGRRWLVVADGEVRTVGAPGVWPAQGPPHGADAEEALGDGRLLLAAPPGPEEGEPVLRLPLADIRGCHVEPLVAAGALVADTARGPRALARFSSALSTDFGLVARAVEAAAKGEAIRIDPRDLPRYCHRCGRRLQANTRVCPTCVDRGAVLRRLLAFSWPYRYRMALAGLLMIFGTALGVLPPKIMEWITDGLVYHTWPWRGPGAIGMLTLLVGALLATRVLGSAATIWQERTGVWVGSHVMGNLRDTLWRGLQGLSLAYFDKAQVGQIMQRINGDTQRLQNFLTDGVQYVVGQVLQLLFALGMMLSINWKLTLVVLLPAPALLAFSYVVWPRVIRLDRRLWMLFGRLNVVVNDALSGIRVVKAFGQEPREITRFDRISGGVVRQSVITGNVWSTVFPIFGFVSGLGGILVWYVGGLLVFHQTIQFGEIVAVTGYMGMLLGPIQWFSQLINWALTSLTSAERIFEVLDTEPEVREAQAPVDVGRIDGRIRLEDVHFGYAPHIPVLRGITLDVAPGEMIGLVGHSGAGKSTLINLICRLYDPDAGTVTVDGMDLRRIRMDDLRRQFGVVLQDTFLFDGTVAENIAYARPEAGPADIMRAAWIANPHDFIVRMPDGYETRIGEGGPASPAASASASPSPAPCWAEMDGEVPGGPPLLDAAEVRMQRGPTGALRLSTPAVTYLQVACYRAFPLTAPEEWIVFFDGRGEHIGILPDVSALEPPSAEACREELDLRYVVPRVTRVASVREEVAESRWNPALVWDLETERGPLRLHLPNLENHVRPLGPGRLLLVDRDCRRAVLEPAGLGPHDLALVQRYLWLDPEAGT